MPILKMDTVLIPHGIMHKDEYSLSAGDVILAEEGDYIKVVNESDHDQLVYLEFLINRVGEAVPLNQTKTRNKNNMKIKVCGVTRKGY